MEISRRTPPRPPENVRKRPSQKKIGRFAAGAPEAPPPTGPPRAGAPEGRSAVGAHQRGTTFTTFTTAVVDTPSLGDSLSLSLSLAPFPPPPPPSPLLSHPSPLPPHTPPPPHSAPRTRPDKT